MNTNDLPPAARLAALIEAGRAANPDIKHGQCTLFKEKEACAIGFAMLGSGVSRESLPDFSTAMAACHLGFKHRKEVIFTPRTLTEQVVRMNDSGASLRAICKALREGDLAKVPA
jgi:hypothetical protein